MIPRSKYGTAHALMTAPIVSIFAYIAFESRCFALFFHLRLKRAGISNLFCSKTRSGAPNEPGVSAAGSPFSGAKV